MLASLLPGLRELRTPLAAGYIWLAGLWLSLRSILRLADHSTGIGRDIVNLTDWAGKPATFAIITFVAYLVGTLSSAATDIIDRTAGWMVSTIGRGHLERLKPAYWAYAGEKGALLNAVANRLSGRFLEDQSFRDAVMKHAVGLQEAHAQGGVSYRLPYVLASEQGERLEQQAVDSYRARRELLLSIIDTDPFVDIAQRDLEYVAPRLIGKEDIVYGEYDRLDTEGSFRINLFLPLVYLFGSLALIASPWWAMGFVAPVALVWLGSHTRSLARQYLVVALEAGRVESPGLDSVINGRIEFVPYQDFVVEK